MNHFALVAMRSGHSGVSSARTTPQVRTGALPVVQLCSLPHRRLLRQECLYAHRAVVAIVCAVRKRHSDWTDWAAFRVLFSGNHSASPAQSCLLTHRKPRPERLAHADSGPIGTAGRALVGGRVGTASAPSSAHAPLSTTLHCLAVVHCTGPAQHTETGKRRAVLSSGHHSQF